MARVTGIGGIFFKAKDPEALSRWYREHLGVSTESWGGAIFHWRVAEGEEPGCTIWSPFREDSKYFEPSQKPFMINLRVDDLDALLASLREKGARVLDRREDSEQGRFGYVVDPEENLLELWQPPPAGATP
jgi:predicted enzyme related to lactoylglutathione lyase